MPSPPSWRPPRPRADLAAVEHRATIPAALTYGNVRIGAYGERDVVGYPDTAAIVYYDSAGALSDHGGKLGAAAGFYRGDSVPLSGLLDGQYLSWLAGTVNGGWYDVKYFKLTWTYYALVWAPPEPRRRCPACRCGAVQAQARGSS